jgi:hypothetical protein
MGTLESLPSGAGTPLQGEKTIFLLKKGIKICENESKKNPGYSVGVQCNNVILNNIVDVAVKGNTKFFQSINQSYLTSQEKQYILRSCRCLQS